MNLPKTMKALQLLATDQLAMTTLPLPSPKADEVLIQTKSTTICTSDLHDIKTNPFGIKLPKVLGHEGAGVIAACGADVKDLTPGMRVAAHPVVPCGECEACRRGLGHLCLNMGHLGLDRDGTFAAYFVQRADRIMQLPDTVTFKVGSLLEPVANCLEAIARSGDIRGKVVLVVGDGPFGNIIARLAHKKGAARVLVSGRTPFRLGMIPGAEIVDTPPLHAVDVAVLAVSAPEAVATCMASLRKRGRLVVFSMVEKSVPVNLFDLHIAELEIVGCCNDENMMGESLKCLQDPSLNLSAIVTHEIPFENWEEAFHLARDRHDQALKVAMVFD
jgi:threonine dehydrogenase-like Zn-dependent dehydrogenase